MYLKRSKLLGTQFPWQILMILMLGLVIPTACVIWFMNEAVNNERLAVKQKVHALYRSQLTTIKQNTLDFWNERMLNIKGAYSQGSARDTFYSFVEQGVVDSLLIYSNENSLLYPTSIPNSTSMLHQTTEARQPKLHLAETLEFQDKQIKRALSLYQEIEGTATNISIRAKSIMAQARCFSKLGDSDKAIATLTKHFLVDKLSAAFSQNGAQLQANALFRALQLINENKDVKSDQENSYRQIVNKLENMLSNYRDYNISSPQRLYLLSRLNKKVKSKIFAKWLNAEELASRFVAVSSEITETGSFFSKTQLPDIWQFGTRETGFIALLDLQTIQTHLHKRVARLNLPNDIRVRLRAHNQTGKTPNQTDKALAFIAIDDFMPGWRIVLASNQVSPFEEAAKRQIDVYLWTGILIIIAIIILTTLTALYVAKQIKISRLKNDLIATVSHELKTPLASMRLLVDTLLNNKRQYDEQTEDYLRLISKENVRLTRLIDNFLTFSRMERNKQVFAFQPIGANLVAKSAVEAIEEKYLNSGFTLEVQYLAQDAAILADSDMLITALINLLENAFKYSQGNDENIGSIKKVTLGIFIKEGELHFSVRDHGIGIESRNIKRIFERFYRVEQRLSQETDGCGLGLSIVNFIVQSHDGRITVDSELKKGSCFTIHIPYEQLSF